MRCIKCQQGETQVIDSRDDGKEVWRRRECLACGYRFTTYERIEFPKLYVIKKDGRRELFSREKLLNGLRKACEKRPVALGKLEEVVGRIESTLYETGKKEIPSKLIGQLAMEELKKIDEVAYIRFASVYRAFKSVESFEKEVHKIMEGK
jgi:transcriptional repressor NrdR